MPPFPKSVLLDDLGDAEASSPLKLAFGQPLTSSSSMSWITPHRLLRIARQARAGPLTTKEPTTEAPTDAGSTEAPVDTGPSITQQIKDKGEEMFEKGVDFAAKKTKLPVWGVILILIGKHLRTIYRCSNKDNTRDLFISSPGFPSFIL